MPLQRRLPKFGFTNIERVEYKPINLSVLESVSTKLNVTAITPEVLVEAGLVSKNDRIKILGNGTVTKALNVTAHVFSKSAVAAIEGAQGSIVNL
jgi:large subunit ribosomal protein L15